MKFTLATLAAVVTLTASTAAHAGSWYETEGAKLRKETLAQMADYIRADDMNSFSFQLGYFHAIANVCPTYDFELHPIVEGYAALFEELFFEDGTSSEMHDYAAAGVKVFRDRVRNNYNEPACQIAAGEGLATKKRGWW